MSPRSVPVRQKELQEFGADHVEGTLTAINQEKEEKSFCIQFPLPVYKGDIISSLKGIHQLPQTRYILQIKIYSILVRMKVSKDKLKLKDKS